MIKKYTISVIGTGYVGLPMATSFASLGHKVFCVDKDNSKLEALKNGKITIFENGLEELFKKVQKKNPMEFTSNTCEAITQSDIIFIAVGTPMNNDGSVDMRFIWSTADDLVSCIDSKKVIVIKSTVPPGATINYKEYLEKKSGKRNLKVAFMPEFLKEGHALEDFMHPDRTIIGTEDKKSISKLKELFSFTKTPILICDTKTAELVKYTANTYLATKISFINESYSFKCSKTAVAVTVSIEESPSGIVLFKSKACNFILSLLKLWSTNKSKPKPCFIFASICLRKLASRPHPKSQTIESRLMYLSAWPERNR